MNLARVRLDIDVHCYVSEIVKNFYVNGISYMPVFWNVKVPIGDRRQLGLAQFSSGFKLKHSSFHQIYTVNPVFIYVK